jgi:tRNA 2-selenouridine synthase
MLIEKLTVQQFLEQEGVILDVRSPGEYKLGHIPGAINLPLFSDQERANVGLIYKTEGKERAIELGLKYVGPQLINYVHLSKTYLNKGIAKVHCWRGGMRSLAVTMLLQTVEMSAVLLFGGYKAYRKWALELFSIPYKYLVIGGLTGSGKTSILHALKNMGEQVLDLEALANHRGSSFGSIKMSTQPTTEQFQNDLAMQLSCFDINKSVWVEDESRMIGSCHIPEVLFSRIKQSPLFEIQNPLQERIERLTSIYGKAEIEELIQATERIAKKLGGARTKKVILAIQEGRLAEATEMLLEYYDSAYQYALLKRQQVRHRCEENFSPEQWAIHLLKHS